MVRPTTRKDTRRRATPCSVTLGALHDVWQWRGLDFAVGADLTLYGVPDALAPTHGSRPVSFHIYGRIRPPASLSRMWNHFMTKPMLTSCKSFSPRKTGTRRKNA